MTVYVCQGSDCRKNKGTSKVLALIANQTVVGCQKVCKGSIVGCVVDGQLEWFSINGRKARLAFAQLLTFGVLKKALEKRRVAKRAGKLR